MRPCPVAGQSRPWWPASLSSPRLHHLREELTSPKDPGLRQDEKKGSHLIIVCSSPSGQAAIAVPSD